MNKRWRSSVVLILVGILCGNAVAAARPNFIFIQGEAQGWASMSVQLDPDHPESRSFLREISTGFRLTQRLHLKWNPST